MVCVYMIMGKYGGVGGGGVGRVDGVWVGGGGRWEVGGGRWEVEGGERWEVGGVERRGRRRRKRKVGRVLDCMILERRDRGGGYVRQG